VIKNRIILAVWLLAAIGLHIFGNEYGTRVILYSSVLAPAVLIVLTWAISRRMVFAIEIPEKIVRGEEVNIRIYAKGGWRILGHVKCRLQWENLLTGEKGSEKLVLRPGSHTVNFCNNHCGVLAFRLAGLAAVDIFGLYAWRINDKPCNNMFATPEIIDMQIEVNPEESMSPEAQEYSMSRPGNDTSETFAIREYMPGDPIKSIHWKLSQKTDRLLVRELGMPVASNILVLMETGRQGEPNRINEMASRVFGISYKLILLGLPHTIGWLDTKTGCYESREITRWEDSNAVFYALFSNTVKDFDITAVEALGTLAHAYSQVFIEQVVEL